MRKLFNTKNMVLIAMFSALATVLMLIEFQLPFLAPSFYEMDLSEIPIMIGTFIIGPVAGVIMEAIKILINLLINGTDTNYVGEFANFCIGCCFVVPAGIIYRRNKTKKSAIIGLIVGSLSMALMGFVLNYFVMLPFFSKFYNTPMDVIIGMGKAILPIVKDKFTFVLFCVVPFNIIKGIGISVVTLLVYKRISTFIKRISQR